MIIKMIMILLVISPLCNGITYYFVSNHPTKPYIKFAKFKNIDDDYKQKNKKAAIVYCVLGLIILLFMSLMFYLYNFFEGVNVVLKIFGIYLFITIMEQGLFDTVINLRFQMEEIQ